MIKNKISDRAIGCLLGLAVGDSLGTTIEFQRPGTFSPLTDIVGGGPFNLLPGQWTDDTSMALCLAESLVECRGFDLRDQMERYVRWMEDGHWSVKGYCFDIGTTVRQALKIFIARGNPEAGSTHPHSAGNGCIMRLAPVPIFFTDPREAITRSADSSRGTHGTTACLDACRYLGSILWGLIHGASKEEVLAPLYHPAGDIWTNLHPAVAAIAEGSFKKKNPPNIRGTGYVIDCLEAALWAFHRSKDFREGALLAVNLGDDADTTGAVFGQLAGAYYGRSGIPAEWVEKVYWQEKIVDLASSLVMIGSGNETTRK